MTGIPLIHKATPGDAPCVAEIIAKAFGSLPVAEWLVPDESKRERILAANFLMHTTHVISECGVVHLLDDRSAAAVWIDRTKGEIPLPYRYDQYLAVVCGPYADQFRALDAVLDSHLPHGEPVHHLAFLAVLPEHQGTGRGSALLDYHHTTLDQAAIPAYLEASSTRSRDFYTRHGYVAAEPFHLPDGPPFYPMTRSQPRPHRSSGPHSTRLG